MADNNWVSPGEKTLDYRSYSPSYNWYRRPTLYKHKLATIWGESYRVRAGAKIYHPCSVKDRQSDICKCGTTFFESSDQLIRLLI